MNTTLVANNLPLREITSTIAKTINIIFGEDNISNINFGYNAIWMETKICAMFSILMRRCIKVASLTNLHLHSPQGKYEQFGTQQNRNLACISICKRCHQARISINAPIIHILTTSFRENLHMSYQRIG